MNVIVLNLLLRISASVIIKAYLGVNMARIRLKSVSV